MGVLICFSGIVFIFWDSLEDFLNVGYRMGLILMFLGITGWVVGTVFSKHILLKTGSIFLNLFYQFTFAGIVQIIFGFLFSPEIDFQKWRLEGIFATVYLAIFGSFIAFFAFNYLLQRLLPTQVAILSYVNTIIAIFLGWLLLDDRNFSKIFSCSGTYYFGRYNYEL